MPFRSCSAAAARRQRNSGCAAAARWQRCHLGAAVQQQRGGSATAAAMPFRSGAAAAAMPLEQRRSSSPSAAMRRRSSNTSAAASPVTNCNHPASSPFFWLTEISQKEWLSSDTLLVIYHPFSLATEKCQFRGFAESTLCIPAPTFCQSYGRRALAVKPSAAQKQRLHQTSAPLSLHVACCGCGAELRAARKRKDDEDADLRLACVFASLF